ncbi:MAG: hypothetical protein B6I20_05260 [Bacteroidetes bacterium 4572_117]|nr:MAG: hypothetical protein B6I20_05260 [Bacteroidetes bacterium 4572_117]
MNKPEFYPYVLLPEEIEKIKIEGIPVPEIKELPSFPIKPKKRFLGTIILGISIIIIIVLSSTKILDYSYKNGVIAFMLLIAIVSLTATVFEILQNGKLKKVYKSAKKKYDELKIERETLIEKRSKAVDDNNNPSAIESYRHDSISKYFRYSYNKIQAVKKEQSIVQKRFVVFLEQYFEGKILENVRITHDSKNIEYSPNFVIKLDNPKVNIAIDIEEPYLFEGSKIVIKKNKSDQQFAKRYQVTNELRWISVVFNEEQIVSNPTGACKLIAHTIDEISLKSKFSGNFKTIEKLKRIEIPGQRELSGFIRSKYREKYLLEAGLIDKKTYDSYKYEVPGQKSKPSKEKDEKQAVLTNIKIESEQKPETNLEDKQKKVITDKKIEIIKDDKHKKLANWEKEETDKDDKQKKVPTEKKEETDKDDKQKKLITEKKEETGKRKKVEKLKTKKEEKEKNLIIDKNIEERKKPIEIQEQLQIVMRVTEKVKRQKLEKEKLDKEKEKTDDKNLLKKKEEEQKDLPKTKLETTKETDKNALSDKKGRLKKEAEILNKLYSSTSNVDENKGETKKDKLEKERLEKENKEKERLEKDKLEKERLEKDKLEKERLEKDKLEKERLEKEKLEKERLEKDKLEKERLEKDKLEKERLEKEKLEKERLEKDKLEKERLEKEKLEKERIEKENKEKERLEKEKVETNKNGNLMDKNEKLMEENKNLMEDLVLTKDWDKLLQKCNQLINKFPYWDWPYYRRSTVFGNQGRFDKVVSDCNKALALNPTLSEAYYNRGTAKFFKEEYKDAVYDYKKCIELKYNNPMDVHFNMGLCYQYLELHKQAYAEFVKAQEMGSNKATSVISQQYSEKQP